MEYNYNLFLDDIRTPEMAYIECIRDTRFLKEDWVIVKSYNEFWRTVQCKFEQGSFPKLVAFDHDLADKHYETIGFNTGNMLSWYEQNKDEKTGYHAAKWFVNFVANFPALKMPEVIIHTRNSAGKLNIKSLFETYYKAKERNIL